MNNKKFVSFITAGDPSLDKTKEFIEVLSEYSDFVEVGIPFSDPIAEGDVIEAANARALAGGTTTEKVFDMLKTVKLSPAKSCKLVILTYINPVFAYGYDKFGKRCKECGVHDLVIPDLPFEERAEVEGHLNKYGVHLITLLAPTSAERVKKLASVASGGFVYLVSSMGTTGVRTKFDSDLAKTVTQIKKSTKIPVCVGFGISTPEQAQNIRKIADGVIVGSAIVKIIAEHGNNSDAYIKEYIQTLVN